jgi:hypothetical protein
MSADRELLELAAKAVGYIDDATTDGNEHGLHKGDNEDSPNPFYVVGPDGWVDWNPLTDDGDCARLEAALLIELLWHEGGVQAGRRKDAFAVYDDFHKLDRNAVRRRVVVETAARIGKEMS